MLDATKARMNQVKPWGLLWMSLLSLEMLAAVIAGLVSFFFHGKVVRFYLIAGGASAFPASFLISLFLIKLTGSVKKAETKAGEDSMIARPGPVMTDGRGTTAGTPNPEKDIAEREKREDPLQEQKRFTEKLLESSAVATFVIDTEHRVVLWNKACEELTGVSSSAIVGTGDHWKPFYPSKRQTLADVIVAGNFEDLAGLYSSHARSVLIEKGLQTQGWYGNLNGRNRYLIFDAAPVYDSRGKLAAAIETLQDLTSQKHMEEELARSEGQLRAIIDTEPECVKLFALDGTILEMNRAGLAMVEADSPEQIVGKSMMPCIVPDYRAAVRKHSEGAYQGSSETIEFEIVGLKGARRWLESRIAPLRNAKGEIYALLGVSRDITERKRWERQMQEQLRFLQLMIDTIPIPVFYKDVHGVYLGYNRAFEEFLGIPKSGLVGRTVYDIAPRELAETYFRKDRELFDSPGIQVYEFSVKHADGTLRDVVFNKATYTDAQGNTAGLIGVMQDMTERKKAEQVIKRNYDTQTAINWVLNISLRDISLESVLKQTLDLLLSIPWLSHESRGSIFLVENDPNTLVMKAQRGLSGHVRQQCRTVPFGACLCGRAAARREVQFTDAVDDRHEVQYDGMGPHGHYCVPIMHAKTVLGVINLYLKAGHREDEREIEFLNAMASALAGIIRRKQTEEEREELIGDLRTVLDAISRSYKE